MKTLQAANVAISSTDAAYLKHSGEINDIKVTVRIVDGFPMIYIRDAEHRSFKSALAHIQHIVASEIVNVEVRP